MHERIKEIRKAKHLTQSEFGAKLGVKGNTVTTYETGVRLPSDAVILAICREFNVDEHWLRTGEGEMFRPKSRNEELLEFAVMAAESPSSDIKAKLLHVMAKLTDEQWELLAEIARKWAKEEADQD